MTSKVVSLSAYRKGRQQPPQEDVEMTRDPSFVDNLTEEGRVWLRNFFEAPDDTFHFDDDLPIPEDTFPPPRE